MTSAGRALTTFAVGFFLLDALLLVWAGLELHRDGLVAGGVLCAGAAAGVIVLWRRYRRVMGEYEAGRRAMKLEVESIRQLLKDHHLHN